MTTRSADGAKSLPGSLYTDPSVFAAEEDRIFARSWLYAGRASELEESGAFRLCEIGRESVIVLRDDRGRLRAFYNVCRHRGTRLCGESSGTFAKTIRCPYHAWTYSLQGELVGAPNMAGVRAFDPADWPLRPVAVEQWEGGIFLNLAEEPRPLGESLAPLRDRFGAWRLGELESAHRIVYDVAANWKLVFQNYSECYHCPSLHPVLNRLTPYRGSSNELEEGPILGGPMRMARDGGSMTMSGERCAAPLGDVAGEDLHLVHYYTVFPNLLLSYHPDYVLVHEIRPRAHDRTEIACDWLFHPEETGKPGFDPSPAVEFWNMTNRQDWEVSERVQKGVASRGYTPGPYADLESTVAAWDREYLRVMGR